MEAGVQCNKGGFLGDLGAYLRKLGEERVAQRGFNGNEYIYSEIIDGFSDIDVPWSISVYNEADLKKLQKRFGSYRLFTAVLHDCEIPNDAQRIIQDKRRQHLYQNSVAYFSPDIPEFGKVKTKKLYSIIRDIDLFMAARISMAKDGHVFCDPFITLDDWNDYEPCPKETADRLKLGMGCSYDSSGALTLDKERTMGRANVLGLVISMNPDGSLKVKESHPI